MNNEQNPMDAVLDAIRRIQQEKRDAGMEPDHVLLGKDQLYARINTSLTVEGFQKTLKVLQESGKIHIGPTMHDTYVREIETNNLT